MEQGQKKQKEHERSIKAETTNQDNIIDTKKSRQKRITDKAMAQNVEEKQIKDKEVQQIKKEKIMVRNSEAH